MLKIINKINEHYIKYSHYYDMACAIGLIGFIIIIRK